MRRLKAGDFEMFDEMLEEAGVHPRQTRGLPDEETLWKDPPADCRGGIELRREEGEPRPAWQELQQLRI